MYKYTPIFKYFPCYNLHLNILTLKVWKYFNVVCAGVSDIGGNSPTDLSALRKINAVFSTTMLRIKQQSNNNAWGSPIQACVLKLFPFITSLRLRLSKVLSYLITFHISKNNWYFTLSRFYFL